MNDLSPDAFKRAMIAYARSSPSYRRLVQGSLSEIRELIDKHGDEVYVSYSGGKDSIVLLHLAARVNPTMQVFHWDHGMYLMPRDVEREIVDITRRIAPRAVLRVESSRSLWDPAARWDPHRWYRAFWARLEKMARDGWRVALLGIRAGESISRRLRTREPCKNTRIHMECYPIRQWSWRDVWAYIFEHSLPYPSVYNEYCPLLGWDKCRLVTFYDEEFRHLGTNIDGIIMWRHKHSG